MKFAQYLRDTQTPEWKKAYIDYRGLKKRITAIRKSQQSLSFYALSSDDSPDEDNSPPAAPRPSDLDLHELERSIDLATRSVEEIPSTKSGKEAHGTSAPLSVEGESEIERSKSVSPSSTNGFKDQRSARGNTSFATPSFKATRDKTLLSRMNSFGGSPRHAHPLAALPLHELLTQLSPYEVSFFILLDAQLDKVESFYLAREKEMLARGHTLRIQLNELNDHRKLFHESHTKEPWTAAFASKIRNTIGLYPPIQLEPAHHGAEAQSKALAAASTVTVENDVSHSKAAEDGLPIAGTGTPSSQRSTGKQRHLEEEGGQDLSTDESGQEERTQPHNIPLSADPDSYLYAKRKLKKAVLEHYR
ncbi:SPX domain-containing protein [Flammula alnicola]|nr:SPX domain-containing protein [Flammula alnicola]